MSKPLWEDILEFHKNRQLIGILLVILGSAGLLLPILPGVLVILLGLALLAPDKFGSILSWMRTNQTMRMKNLNEAIIFTFCFVVSRNYSPRRSRIRF